MTTTHEVPVRETDALVLLDPRTGEELHLPAREAEHLLAALFLTNHRYSIPLYGTTPVRVVNTTTREWLGERVRFRTPLNRDR